MNEKTGESSIWTMHRPWAYALIVITSKEVGT